MFYREKDRNRQSGASRAPVFCNFPGMFRLRNDEDVLLVLAWHNHYPAIHVLEIFVILNDLCEGSSSNVGFDTLSSGTIKTNIRRMMLDLNMPPEGSMEGSNSNSDVILEKSLHGDLESHEGSVVGNPMTNPYQMRTEHVDILDEEEEEINYFTDSLAACSDPTKYFPNVQSSYSRVFFKSRRPDDDSTNEFKIGQQFQNKEVVLMAVTMYNIKRAMEYKILENNNWNYSVHCTHFGMGCKWGIHVSYHQTCGKWEVNRYNGVPILVRKHQ
ncbi:hypothetical protein PIB30_009309 [Stylosanthes scabra]|uniref:Transposase MuDR plant domain-containing protein n=1 Tax=Stylosanthes scabra TaxID=79078 RepID=A0ABU6T644_9FABA|nr:hypothetical protein [Stylosanthes scabra]